VFKILRATSLPVRMDMGTPAGPMLPANFPLQISGKHQSGLKISGNYPMSISLAKVKPLK